MWPCITGSRRSARRLDRSVRNTTTAVKVVEMDELHSYVGHKKTIAGFGRLLIDMGGDSSVALCVPATQARGESFGKPSSDPESRRS